MRKPIKMQVVYKHGDLMLGIPLNGPDSDHLHVHMAGIWCKTAPLADIAKARRFAEVSRTQKLQKIFSNVIPFRGRAK